MSVLDQITPTSFDRFLKREKNLPKFIPYTGVYENCTLTKNSELCMTWHINGRYFETSDNDDMNIRNEQLNTFMRNMTSAHTAIYVHRARLRAHEKFEADFNSKFGNDFAHRYYDVIGNDDLMRTDLYITLVYRIYATVPEKATMRAAKRNFDAIRNDLAVAYETMLEYADKVESSLRRYEPRLLKTYVEDGVEYNEQLSFFNFLLTFQWQKVRLPVCGKIPVMLDHYLGNCSVKVVDKMIEIETPQQKRFAQNIELKDYNSFTEVGMLDELLSPEDGVIFEFVECQSFAFMAKHDAKKYLITQKNRLRGSEDGAVEQMEALDVAVNDLIDGRFSVGEYSYSLIVLGNTVKQARDHTQVASAILQNCGFLPFVSRGTVFGAWISQLPANFKYRPRISHLTSKNFVQLAPLNNFPRGKQFGNPWGKAVIPLLTPWNQIVYFNFHDSPAHTNNYDDKLLGNTMVIGKSGSGKTVILTAFLSFLQQYRLDQNGNEVPFNAVYFDKDRGAEIAIRAQGGGYLAVSSGEPSGFNPFQMENTPENQVFLQNLIVQLLKQANTDAKVTTTDIIKIEQAIKAVMNMPKEKRRLSIVLQNITKGSDAEEKENSLHNRLKQWVGNGIYSWVFDKNHKDLLDFRQYPVFGIDGTAFLDDPQARTPIAMYLLHRLNDVIDGRRFVYFMDEFWKWLEDPIFSNFCKDKQLTIRKQNGFGVFATQQPDIVTSNPNASALVGQLATMIFLPNPSAKYEHYKGFGISQNEFTVIKQLNEDSRMFVVKQTGYDTNGNIRSFIASFDLSAPCFKDDLRILSGSTDNLPVLYRAMEECGEDPEKWVPRYLELKHLGLKIN
ncbi:MULTISPECIES: hypothetical protein [Snodgrassella]|uniref:VirB4 family type IV secretion/conjugal transfer ATPase n=1 Tax=Snodgrassella TaxID=1193515 RepID=UPI0008159B4B|nr:MULTISPECIES: hypothetical protein [Snodgrassella]MCO6521226.1 hypothetical protein [Snodgrassella sp.]SCC04260.1 type IV secretion system protein VirB4 [Snodgrassella sp. R-53583]